MNESKIGKSPIYKSKHPEKNRRSFLKTMATGILGGVSIGSGASVWTDLNTNSVLNQAPPDARELRIKNVKPFIAQILDGRVVVQPKDTGTALVNPGMGWQFHHYDNNIVRYGLELEPSDTVDEFPGLSSIYLRLAWAYIEPEEGKFNWSIVDTPAARWIAKGKQVCFRFSCFEGGTAPATPEWVRKAGAKINILPARNGASTGDRWEVDFDDPIFLDKLDHFLAAAAARYDGSPEVAFIDVGSFGTWGEGHTSSGSGLPYSASTIRRHIDLHKKHFKHTLLAANDDFSNQGRGLEVIQYAHEQGLTLRDDSILVNPAERAYYHAYLAPMFWNEVPIILESEHYGPSKTRGNWGDGSRFIAAIEDYHASYATVHWYPREFLKECRPLIDQINMRLGYRLQLQEVSWPSQVQRKEPFSLGYRWRNAGVAPCLPGGYPAITLKDVKGGIAGVFVDEGFDMRTLPVGPPEKSVPVGREVKAISQASKRLIDFALPQANILKPGNYTLWVSIGTRSGTPKIALPLPDEDDQRRYRLGEVLIVD